MTHIKHRAGTTTQWASPTQGVLQLGEFGLNTTTGEVKIGDGVTAFAALPLLQGAAAAWSAITGKPAVVGAGATQAAARDAIGAGTDAHADTGDATTLTTATGRAIAFSIALG